eukprot:33630-Pelagomonas_calceolata.AAC.1
MVPHSRGHADRILRHHPWPLVVAEGATCAAFHCTQSTSRGTADETAADVCLPGCGALAVRGRDFRGSEAGCLLLGVDHAVYLSACKRSIFPAKAMLFRFVQLISQASVLLRILNCCWYALCLPAAQRWGRKSVWLRVCPTNTAALQLYRSLGYEEVQLREPLWFKSLRRNDDVFMCKSIPQMPPLSCFQQKSVKSIDVRDRREVSNQLTLEALEASGEKKKVYKWGEEE